MEYFVLTCFLLLTTVVTTMYMIGLLVVPSSLLVRLVLIVAVCLLGSTGVSAENLYIGQSSAGGNTGADCANQKAISFFNTAGNWGAGAGKISAGDTVYLCGTITTAMGVQGSGSAGNLITISPAPSQTTTINATGLTGPIFRFNGNQYVVLDGVDGDKVAGDTNYRLIFSNIAATLAVNTYAVYENDSGSNVAVKHVKIVVTGTQANDDNAGGVYFSTLGGAEVAYNWITGTSAPNKVAMGVSCWVSSAIDTSYTSGCITHHNYIEFLDIDGLRCGYNCSIYNNYVKEIAGSGHSDGIICQSGDYCQVYNNILDNGAEIYLDNIANATRSHIRVYNNVSYNSGVAAQFGVEVIAEGGPSSKWDDVIIVNNTFYNIVGSCYRGSVNNTNLGVTNLVFLNNICHIATSPSYTDITTQVGHPITWASSTAWDYNAYGTGSLGFPNIVNLEGTSYTLTQLRALSPARETNGKTGNPTFVNTATGDYHLSSSDTVAKGAGINLTSTYAWLTLDKDGVTRPSGSAWDMGAYQGASASDTTPPVAPSSVFISSLLKE